MSEIRLLLLVQKVSEQFHLDGGITPFIDVFPAIELPDGQQITRLCPPISALEQIHIAPKDKISINIAEDGICTIDILEPSDQPRIPMKTDTCPICGAQLLPSRRPEREIGRCIHRACPAQMPHYILVMLSSLGLSFDRNMRHVLEQILSRGILITPVALWSLNIVDLVNPNVSLLDVQMFIQYIHSVRGHCSAKQALTALNIPEWNEPFLRIVNFYWQQNDLSILDLQQLADPTCAYRKEISKMLKEVKVKFDYWGVLDEFLSIGTNRIFFNQLIQVLYM